MKPQVCPFCRSRVSLIDSAKIYDQSYGFIYLCDAYPNCDARVGCHPKTIIALGTLANKELRRWRSLAHRKFDPLWQSGVFSSRQAAYKWLSKAMKLPLKKPTLPCSTFDSAKERSLVLRFLREVGSAEK